VTFIPRDTIPDDVLQFITVEPMGDDRYHEDIEGLVATRVAPHILNIHTEGFDKGKGITHLLEEMKIDKKFAIAFGDEENDESMFDAVGFTVAMGNGNPVLRDQADYVTSSVHKDGIYKAAKHLGLF
jgi:hydroxymethylpyrimidine pyrophosphatase-like HAD family hydrolase